jgi:hypothetical protein
MLKWILKKRDHGPVNPEFEFRKGHDIFLLLSMPRPDFGSYPASYEYSMRKGCSLPRGEAARA